MVDGNSLTLGQGATSTQDFPNIIKNWFLGTTVSSVEFHSFGVGGQTLKTMVTNGPTKTLNIVAPGKVNILILNEDANGIGTDDYTPEYNLQLMQQYCSAAYRAGYDFVITWNGYYMRTPYYSGTTTDDLTRMTAYYNLANSGALNSNKNVDMRNAPNIGGAAGQAQNATYNADWIHLTTAGYTSLANYLITNGIQQIFTF